MPTPKYCNLRLFTFCEVHKDVSECDAALAQVRAIPAGFAWWNSAKRGIPYEMPEEVANILSAKVERVEPVVVVPKGPEPGRAPFHIDSSKVLSAVSSSITYVANHQLNTHNLPSVPHQPFETIQQDFERATQPRASTTVKQLFTVKYSPNPLEVHFRPNVDHCQFAGCTALAIREDVGKLYCAAHCARNDPDSGLMQHAEPTLLERMMDYMDEQEEVVFAPPPPAPVTGGGRKLAEPREKSGKRRPDRQESVTVAMPLCVQCRRPSVGKDQGDGQYYCQACFDEWAAVEAKKGKSFLVKPGVRQPVASTGGVPADPALTAKAVLQRLAKTKGKHPANQPPVAPAPPAAKGAAAPAAQPGQQAPAAKQPVPAPAAFDIPPDVEVVPDVPAGNPAIAPANPQPAVLVGPPARVAPPKVAMVANAPAPEAPVAAAKAPAGKGPAKGLDPGHIDILAAVLNGDFDANVQQRLNGAAAPAPAQQPQVPEQRPEAAFLAVVPQPPGRVAVAEQQPAAPIEQQPAKKVAHLPDDLLY